jgi:hypothetical protein
VPVAGEPWDYEAFLRSYNAIARERGSWEFDPLGRGPEKLRGWYDTGVWDSLYEFALTRFQLDQEI